VNGSAEVPPVLGGQLDERVSGLAGSHHDRLLAHRSPVRSPVGDVGGEQPLHLGQELRLEGGQCRRPRERPFAAVPGAWRVKEVVLAADEGSRRTHDRARVVLAGREGGHDRVVVPVLREHAGEPAE